MDFTGTKIELLVCSKKINTPFKKTKGKSKKPNFQKVTLVKKLDRNSFGFPYDHHIVQTEMSESSPLLVINPAEYIIARSENRIINLVESNNPNTYSDDGFIFDFDSLNAKIRFVPTLEDKDVKAYGELIEGKLIFEDELNGHLVLLVRRTDGKCKVLAYDARDRIHIFETSKEALECKNNIKSRVNVALDLLSQMGK